MPTPFDNEWAEFEIANDDSDEFDILEKPLLKLNVFPSTPTTRKQSVPYRRPINSKGYFNRVNGNCFFLNNQYNLLFIVAKDGKSQGGNNQKSVKMGYHNYLINLERIISLDTIYFRRNSPKR